MNAAIKEAYLALAVSILIKSTPEQSYARLGTGFSKKSFLVRKDITDSDVEEMIKLKDLGMTWDEIGESFGMDMHAAFKRVKRYKERRKKDEK